MGDRPQAGNALCLETSWGWKELWGEEKREREEGTEKRGRKRDRNERNRERKEGTEKREREGRERDRKERKHTLGRVLATCP